MLAVTAIVRPERVMFVQDALYAKGFCALSKTTISGRGKERGIRVGEVIYEELTKVMLYMVIEDDEKDVVVKTIMSSAMTGDKGNPGDGKIFISPVYEAYTISTQTKSLQWCLPVDPKPPSPRSVLSSKSSHTSKLGCSTGTNSI